MVDLIKLPYRNYGTASSVDLRLDGVSAGLADLPYYGRVIQLHPFISGQIHKYKLIENYGNRIYERIFLMSKDIPDLDMWWNGDNHQIYPLQCKVIDSANCAIGRSFKYTSGIIHYLQDYQDLGEIHSVALERVSALNLLANAIIPSPEIQVLSSNMDGIHSFMGPYDQWMNDDVDITELYPNLNFRDISYNGLRSLAATDEIMQGAICIDVDPLEHDWATWELICTLNEIVATDVTITLYSPMIYDPRATFVTNIDFRNRYNLMYEDDITYQGLIHHLEMLAYHMSESRFSNICWDKIQIRKLWSEEVFIDVYETMNPNVISQVLYFDLPIFSLGTLGIYSRPTLYPVNQ